MKLFYDAWYRFGSPPWVGGPRSELVELVSSGRLTPGRALDLGCGEGDNAIFLAQHGFTLTALDFAPSAIATARRKARTAGVTLDLLVDDLTDLRHVNGQFDLLVDYGTLDDLGGRDRDAYIREVLPLAAPWQPVPALVLRVGSPPVGTDRDVDPPLWQSRARAGRC
ncbi:MAG: methyltransferase domain-containing protein [Candidatus Limnocylindria bacterium]